MFSKRFRVSGFLILSRCKPVIQVVVSSLILGENTIVWAPYCERECFLRISRVYIMNLFHDYDRYKKKTRGPHTYCRRNKLIILIEPKWELFDYATSCVIPPCNNSTEKAVQIPCKNTYVQNVMNFQVCILYSSYIAINYYILFVNMLYYTYNIISLHIMIFDLLQEKFIITYYLLRLIMYLLVIILQSSIIKLLTLQGYQKH